MTAQELHPRGSLRVERTLPAPPAEVFRWWTTPQLMAGWLSPTGSADVTADVRVGGSFRVTMRGDGARIEHTGEYIEVDPPRRLVFTWTSQYTAGPSVVTVELESRGDDTRIVLTHEQLPVEHVSSHQDGWGAILGNLSASVQDSSAREREPAADER